MRLQISQIHSHKKIRSTAIKVVFLIERKVALLLLFFTSWSEKLEEEMDYSLPVHRSLMEKKVFFGIGRKAFMVIMIFTAILASITNFIAFGVGIVAIFICRALCKEEPYLIDFVVETLGQRSSYNG